MSKETWYSFLRDDAEKERIKREKRERKKYRVNTKAFRAPQTFGPAGPATTKDCKNYDKDGEKE